jgi:hypothetical protein
MQGELRTIAYFLGDGESATEFLGALGGQAVPGLARLEGDRMAIGYAMEQPALLSGSTKILAPEIAAINFRYFDGIEWLLTWDGRTTGTLPQAVEITLGVRIPDGAPSAGGSGDGTLIVGSDVVRLYRHVVQIPTAAPVTTTSLGTLP